MKAYIISYLPSTFREKRKEVNKIQVNWLLNQGIDEIIILSENYRQNDYLSLKKVRYLDNPQVSCAIGRNILLDIFYQTEDDFCLLLDDDSILYDHWDGKNFLSKMCQLELPKDISLFVPIYPREQPFRQYWIKNEKLLKENYLFKGILKLTAGFIFLRNTFKYFGKKYFFDEDFLWFEDDEFPLQFIKDGLGTYQLVTLVQKEMTVKTSLSHQGADDRKEKAKPYKNMLVKKWESEGVKFNKDGYTINRLEFKKQYWITPSKILVPRYKNPTLQESKKTIF